MALETSNTLKADHMCITEIQRGKLQELLGLVKQI